MLAVFAQAEVSAPPPPPVEAVVPLVPQAFFDDVLAWDLQGNQALKGRQKIALTRTEFFQQVGRLDLIDKSDAIRTRRVWFAVTAGVAALGGGIGGVFLLSGSPNMNSAFCTANIANFHQCDDDNRFHQKGGIAFIAGGAAIAMLMATLAWWSNPDVVDGDEATHLVAQYNAGLLKRLRVSSGPLKWLPLVSADGALLAVSGRF